jgi:hypothetical protein
MPAVRKQVHIRLDSPVKRLIKQAARMNGRSVSREIELAIKEKFGMVSTVPLVAGRVATKEE